MALKTLLPLLSLYATLASCAPTLELPVIDLGYVKQQATVYNSTHDYYIFKNIRFAAPPLGDLRFRKPVSPFHNGEIQNGNITETACVQTVPLAAAEHIFTGSTITMGVEDCLFLDVYVPASIKATDKAPVFQWFYGGAYTIGSKDMWGDPTGLMNAADEPMIYVASNYRLGAFGWLADAEQDIDMNVGLHDVRAAMDWVSEYISEFGGDPERITVVGESAGGGVIMHTIVSYGGEHSPPPFKQAILQSAGMVPDKDDFKQRNNTYQRFQMAANCTSIKCLREAPTETLIASNEAILKSGLVQFTPAVDGDYIPDLPSRLLSQGKFHHVDSIIASNTWFESGLFIPSPDNVTSESFNGYIQTLFPNASASVVSGLTELYPKGSDEIEEYKRVTDFFQDVLFSCNAVALAQAFGDDAYRYIFNVSRAWHGDDVYYNFYNPGSEEPGVVSVWAAKVHQEYLVDYTVNGEPGCADTRPCFTGYSTSYGVNSLVISDEKVEILSADPWDNERCDFLVNVAWA